ncbi:methyl-accepting chemotaxis protein [Neorhizobium sp. Rsf11]|uniref:Methyl-accepting chemotaxis protein n=2 Tax=Neorhizobium TaxID=1525371 RepID=A0ABV0M5S4_9HYPH|nr:methyl-accepting chemotaxis protein [Neorhizobium petrolearium]MCC2611730.1 methyl-accepting chemotaxis protein [Neorhizobium petrolearium]WGI66902.1 methyl-accepting chemotaxis protein [Neorhizobium petrolearium]
MSRLSIRSSLIAVFGAIAALTAVLAWAAISSLSNVAGNLNTISGDSLPSVQASKNIETAILGMTIAYMGHLTTTSDFGMEAAEKLIAQQSDALKAALDTYRPLTSSDQEKQLVDQIEAGVQKYVQAGEKMLGFSRKASDARARVEMEKMRITIQPVMEAVTQLVKTNTDAAGIETGKAEATYATALTTMYAILAVVFALIVGAAAYVMTGIARPIQRITASMSGLAAGDTETEIPFAGRKDEVGAMAGAVEVFRQAAISNRQLQEEAEKARAHAEADRIRLQEEAEAAAQTRLQEATAVLAAGLRRLASGDLAFQLTEPFAPDFEALREDLNSAVTRLGAALSEVASSAGSIDSGSREVSQSADDLSKRTEQQAASLEETAAALDEITANVANSSRRADEAKVIALEANSSAAKSGAVVANAVDAMQRIEQSSNQISNIIGVIDEIAFQTNLLALNAGVEAARAGEAGKGFAVVAQEVRELAQRSANAAKEIKDLIRNSGAEVHNGVKLVRETGDALKTIEAHVVTINEHISAIATAAREQSVGLAEVNSAVNQMDQVTQQNAAMVEETNAAGANLASESSKLRELIARFKLAERGRMNTAPRAVSSSGATPVAAPRNAAPQESPARRLAERVTKSFGGNAAAAAAPTVSQWTEF